MSRRVMGRKESTRVGYMHTYSAHAWTKATHVQISRINPWTERESLFGGWMGGEHKGGEERLVLGSKMVD